MAKYRLKAIGADFEIDDEGCDYIDSEAANRAALKAGIAIAAEEIAQGKKSSIIEAQVLDDDLMVGRYVIALSVEALKM